MTLTGFGVGLVAFVSFWLGVWSGRSTERKGWKTSARPGTNIHFTPDGRMWRVFEANHEPTTEEILASQTLRRACRPRDES